VSLPHAIRQDHSPFSIGGFVPGYVRLLTFLRWTSYQCPHCKHVFRRDFWLNTVRLGSGERKCNSCGTIFDDGSREWPQLSVLWKLRFFFPPPFAALAGGMLLAGTLAAYGFPPHDPRMLVACFIMVLAVAVPWSLFRVPWVIFSVRRYNSSHPAPHA